MKRGSYQILYYSPTSNFVTVNNPEKRLTCDKSIYEDMEQVSGTKTVPIPRQFYTLMPNAQKEYESGETEKNSQTIPAANESNTIPARVAEPETADVSGINYDADQSSVQEWNDMEEENSATRPQMPIVPAAAAMDEDINNASQSEEMSASSENAEASGMNPPASTPAMDYGRALNHPMNETVTRFDKLYHDMQQRFSSGASGTNRHVPRPTNSFGMNALDSSEDRLDNFARNYPEYTVSETVSE